MRPLSARLAPVTALVLSLVALSSGLALVAHAGHREPAPEPYDLSGYTALLHDYLRSVSSKGEPLETQFDYVQLYVDEGIFRKHLSDRLTTIRGQLLAGDPWSMSDAQRRAWAVNTYNFLVLERATTLLLVPGRKFLRYKSAREMSTGDGTFFEAAVAHFRGKDYSLTGFERHFVLGDTTGPTMAVSFDTRDRPADPRLSFATCQAAIGSPCLLPWPYRADSIEAQLDRAARLSLERPEFLTSNLAQGEVVASNWFFEHRADFGGGAMPGLLAFLQKYAPKPVVATLAKYHLKLPTRFFEVNEALNLFEHPKATAPIGAAGADSSKSAP